MGSIEKTGAPNLFSEEENATPDIYPRFKEVRDALKQCIYEPSDPCITKKFNTFSWGEGVKDHTGSIRGVINDIELSFDINGTSASSSPKNNYMSLKGNFISSDGLEGRMLIVSNAGIINFEAYWLEDLNGVLILEQVVDEDRNVLTREEIEDMPTNRIYICRNRAEKVKLYQLGFPLENIFVEGIDNIKKIQNIESNRQLYIPKVGPPLHMREASILKKRTN